MDHKRAELKVAEFLGLLERAKDIHDHFPSDYYRHPSWIEVDRQLLQRLPLARAIAGEALPHIGADLDRVGGAYEFPWRRSTRATHQLLGALRTAKEAEEILGPQGPSLAARALHPLIWSTAAQLWSDGHPRQAVQTAGAALESSLQATLDKGDVIGTDLASAFSIKDPDDDWPRLRIRDIDRVKQPRTWTAAHEGAGYLVRAAFLFVRNLASHDGFHATEAEYLEQLAVLSTVARIVDRCEVVRRQ